MALFLSFCNVCFSKKRDTVKESAVGAKRTMENCCSLCLSPSVWRQREDKVDRAPILLPQLSHWIWIEGWRDAQRLRTEIAWRQKWDVVRALPRCCSEPGDSGGGGGTLWAGLPLVFLHDFLSRLSGLCTD